MKTKILLSVLVAAAFAAPAFAQTSTTEVQRDQNQQQRIENGLQSGQLSTGEAAQLEHGEAHIDKMEANDMKNGPLTSAEKQQIQSAQNRESNKIYQDKHNGVTGNPNSASSQRMQADVQRNINQQARIGQGLRSGALNNRQAGSLERGQAHVANREANAGAFGHVGAGAQQGIQNAENRQSGRIYSQKH